MSGPHSIRAATNLIQRSNIVIPGYDREGRPAKRRPLRLRLQ